MLNDYIKLITAAVDYEDYEERKLDRLERENNNGIGVSTAYTNDMGYETALLDENGVHPVERYPDKNAATIGHLKWIDFAKDPKNKSVKKLGYGSLVDDRMVELKGR